MGLNLSQPAPLVARELIGCELLVGTGEAACGGFITETEAYTADDPASHSFRGPTKRSRAMFMAPGTLYVYKIYGMHYCLNIVCGDHDGQAVLIRGLRPTTGIEIMMKRRAMTNIKLLTSGPARLTQALGIDLSFNGLHLDVVAWKLRAADRAVTVSVGPRVGISKAVDVPWRFYATDV